MDKKEPMNFFFWIGDDDSPESLTEKDFNDRIEAKQEAERKWRNVEVDG
jgi:hypothetical protein